MTEADWLACADPMPILVFLRERTNDRKRRLFAVACCRSIWGMLPDERARTAVRIAERYADGMAVGAELGAVSKEMWDIVDNWDSAARDAEAAGPAHLVWAKAMAARAAAFAVDTDFPELATVAAEAAILANQLTKGRQAAEDEEQDFLVSLVRDVFGNPFHPVIIDPLWLTPAVVELAQVIYDERAFDQLPLLADALEEAGCHDADILGHCRQAGNHARGCWVVDAVLRKI